MPVKAGLPTKPGTKLKLGEAAVIEFQNAKKGEKYYSHGTMSTSVTKIIKGDPKIFANVKNKADFKDLVPYFVFSETKILSYEDEKTGNNPTSPVVYGLLKDGTESGKAISFSASPPGCENTYFDGPDVGATATKCTLMLAKKGGDPVVGAAYLGDSYVYEDSSDNPFRKKPVVWLP